MTKLEQLRNKLADIAAKMEGFNGLETYSNEQLEEISALSKDAEETKRQIEAEEKVQAALSFASASAGRQTTPAPVTNKAPVEARKDGKAGFKNAGAFYSAVIKHANTGEFSEKLKSQAVEKYGEDGGFLVPDDFRTEIQKKVQADESLITRTRQITTGSNHLTLPVNETAPWDGAGIQAYWEGEAKQMRDSKSKFGLATWRLHKLTALVPVSEELLEDSAALESWIREEAPAAIMHKINHAIINGDGAGKPLGFLNSPFAVTVPAEGGQPAGTINYANLIKMEARLMGDGVWIAHPQAKEQLRQLKDDNGNLIYMNGGQFPNAAARPFDTLLGKPIVYMMGAVPELGKKGDISLVNMSYYISAMKGSGIRQDVSTHVYFDRDLVAFKFTFRVAGECPYKTPVTTENGNYEMSGFVLLADR